MKTATHDIEATFRLLKRYAESGETLPRNAELGELLGLSKATLELHLRHLRAAGRIVVTGAGTARRTVETREGDQIETRPCKGCGKPIPVAADILHCTPECARANNPIRWKRPAQPLAAKHGPRGCATVEEFLAAGGQITRYEPAMPGSMGGIPVMPKASVFSGGRVRR